MDALVVHAHESIVAHSLGTGKLTQSTIAPWLPPTLRARVQVGGREIKRTPKKRKKGAESMRVQSLTATS